MSPVLDGQLQLRLDDTRGTSVAPTLRTSSDGQLVQPRAEVRYRLAPVELKAGYDLALARADTSTGSVGRSLSQRLHGAATVAARGLPSARLDVARRTTRDLSQDSELRDTTAQLSLDHALGALRMSQATQLGWLTDTATALTTRTIQPRGALLFDTALGKAGTLGASYNVAYTDIAQESLAGRAISSPVARAPSRGLYAVTDRPTDTTGRPLVPSPGLVDGNVEASTGISVGPDGVSFQNIGLDMGRLVAIDALRVTVRTSSGFPVVYGGGITWSAYSSTDGALWTPLAGASTSFDATFSRFETSFPATTARYYKVVSFGTSTTEAFVTELEAFDHVLVQPRTTTHSTVLVQSGVVNATAAPHPKLRLSGGASLSRASQASPGSTFASTGWEVSGGAAAGPFWERLTASVAEEVRGSRTTQSAARLGMQSSATVGLRVSDPISVSGEAHRTEERGPADALVSLGARAGAGVVLLPATLEVSGSAGVDRVRTEPGDVETDRVSASAAASARLFPSLTLTGSAAVQTGSVTQPATAAVLFPQPPSSRVYAGTALYRASERLQLGASLSYVETQQHSGFAQQYRVAWDPFPGGAFRLALAYDESIDAVNGSRLARLLLQPSWRINRHATLDGSWSDTAPQGARAPLPHADLLPRLHRPDLTLTLNPDPKRAAKAGLLAVAVAVTLALALGCAGPNHYTNRRADLSGLRKVAVLPFDNMTDERLAGEKVQRLFVTELLNAGTFEVIEPGRVIRVLRDEKIESPGAMSPEDVQRVGRALKADGLVLGTVLELSEAKGAQGAAPVVTIQLKLVETGTGTTVWAATRQRTGATFGSRFLGFSPPSSTVVVTEAVRDAIHTIGR